MDPFTIGLALASTALKSGGKLMAGYAQSKADYAEGELSLLQADLYGINADTAKTNVRLLTNQAEIAGLGEDFAYAKARLQKSRIIEQGRTRRWRRSVLNFPLAISTRPSDRRCWHRR